MSPPTSRSPDDHARARAFKELLEPLIPVFYRNAFRWTTTQDRAEDLVQELLVRLYPRMDELAGLDRVQPWALKVMYRIFVDQHRREMNSPVRSLDALPGNRNDPSESPLERCAADGPGPPELVERELTGERVATAWARLGEDQRVVVAMHDIEGYGLEELAVLLDVPVGTLKSRLHRARGRLRELLAGEPFAAPVRDQGQEEAK
ncbi:RNA polymerase sigma factor [Thioalkalivibrio sp. XN279]|uniref:RNA polymerase sigma factor n=1 Tax=Thioalkalivibrio sp. XN279 TaxID=2714953 RepID=UPI00140A9D64|nr:RNA polymerase sigma factor [Thioalkalivibrio sp. XN279]NHA15508.1 RNA polymerase sigma factor [Thioalkalivibrio sp. XN279]